eukprot:Gb_32954 [translate_table: standard]
MDLEAESPSTLKNHSCHLGKSSPRMENLPQVNRSMEEINKDDGSKPADCSQSKSISPRLRAAVSQRKWKPDDRKKINTFHIIDRNKWDSRVSSSSNLTSKKKTESEKFAILKAKHIAISVGKMKKNGTKDVCRKAETSAITNPLAVHAEATSQAIRDTLAHLDHRELASTSLESKEKMLPQRSKDISSSSVDKILNGGRKWSEEVGHALSDEKCEHPSPVSVLDGPFQEESLSPVDLKETPTNLLYVRNILVVGFHSDSVVKFTIWLLTEFVQGAATARGGWIKD